MSKNNDNHSWTIQITKKTADDIENSTITVTEHDFKRALEVALAYVEDRHNIPIKIK